MGTYASSDKGVFGREPLTPFGTVKVSLHVKGAEDLGMGRVIMTQMPPASINVGPLSFVIF